MPTVRRSARAEEGIASGTYLKLSSVALSLPVATTEIGYLEARKLAKLLTHNERQPRSRLET
jgi:hypothetical protein